MNRPSKTQPAQLGFDALLADAETTNLTRQVAREAAHLPGTMEEAVPFYRGLIERHHAMMLAGEHNEAMRLCDQAHLLATKLNNFEPGILADADSPGNVLERLTRARKGTVPVTESREVAAPPNAQERKREFRKAPAPGAPQQELPPSKPTGNDRKEWRRKNPGRDFDRDR